jgi:type IV pilus assembly protein PilN
MTLNGAAESNASVAEYMRNIEASPWMGQASLSKTLNTHDSTRMPYSFGLTVALNRPKQDDAGKSKAPAGDQAAPAAQGAPASPAPAAAPGKAAKPSVSVTTAESASPARDAAAKGGVK